MRADLLPCQRASIAQSAEIVLIVYLPACRYGVVHNITSVITYDELTDLTMEDGQVSREEQSVINCYELKPERDNIKDKRTRQGRLSVRSKRTTAHYIKGSSLGAANHLFIQYTLTYRPMGQGLKSWK